MGIIKEGKPYLKKRLPRKKLTDGLGRKHNYLRIALTDKCNLRCKYCIPGDLPIFSPNKELMNEDEIVQIARVFTKLGVKRIRLTGGEPLIRQGIEKIIDGISNLPVELNITTNGIYVHHFISHFKKAGINSINISLDTLNPEKYTKITRKDLFSKVLTNIHLLLQQGFHVKLNVVVIQGFNDDEVIEFVQLTHYFPLHVRFIEFMPFLGNSWNNAMVVRSRELLRRIRKVYRTQKIRDTKHSTSMKYRIPGFEGTFAFITTMSRPFCKDCNRIRLTATGKLRNCLFSNYEVDLAGPFRKGEDLEPIIEECLRGKAPQHGGQGEFLYRNKGKMLAIGG